MVPMNWGVYDSSGKLRRRFRSCAAAHRWLIREGLETLFSQSRSITLAAGRPGKSERLKAKKS
jgi:hypothetical protein